MPGSTTFLQDTFQGAGGSLLNVHVSDNGNTYDGDNLGGAAALIAGGGGCFTSGTVASPSGGGQIPIEQIDYCNEFLFDSSLLPAAFQATVHVVNPAKAFRLFIGAVPPSSVAHPREALLRPVNAWPNTGLEVFCNGTGQLTIYALSDIRPEHGLILLDVAAPLSAGDFTLLYETVSGNVTFNGQTLLWGSFIDGGAFFFGMNQEDAGPQAYLTQVLAGGWNGSAVVDPAGPAPAPASSPAGGSSAADPQWVKLRSDLVNHRWKY